MANGDLRVIPTVFAIVIKDGKVLLLKRANTDWLDGYWDLPAGHLEDQEPLAEGAARELEEETGLKAKPADLRLIHLYQNHNKPDDPHYGHMFMVDKWQGDPKITEPEKCSDMKFFDLNELPEKIAPYTKLALQNLTNNKVTITYLEPYSITPN